MSERELTWMTVPSPRDCRSGSGATRDTCSAPDGGDHLVHFRNPGNIFTSGNLALRTQEVPVDAGIPIHRHFEYDKAQQFMVVQLRSAYYPYCEMAPATYSALRICGSPGGPLDPDCSPRHVEATRRYISDFDRVYGHTHEN